MTIQTATRTKPEALPSPVEVMGTHAEALPVTVNGIASRVVLDQQEGTAMKVYRKHFLVPEGLFVAGLGDPAHVSAIGLVLAAFAVKYRPVTDSAAPGLKELHARFGDRVRFVMVEVREAHPGKVVPQPETLDEKMAHAKQLRDLHGFQFEVAVDDIDGTFHRALSPKPNSAYALGTDGTILFRAQWANDTKALAAALAAIAAGEPPTRTQSGGVVRPILRTFRYLAPVLDRAGGGAWGDMWRVAPPMAATAFALKVLRIRPPNPDARER